jgi:NADH-quinone oxidoreductase subunit C
VTKENIFSRLSDRFSGSLEALDIPPGSELILKVSPEKVREIAEFLRDDPDLRFEIPLCASGVDYPPEKIEVIYHLFSLSYRHYITLKYYADRAHPVVSSLTPVWLGFNWHEREIFDLLGVMFEGHPDLRRILLPEDWPIVYPLRKDFAYETYLPMPPK